ncbi:hypothetical protein HG536_0F02280 [Torulaspora globosa]|uniref:Ribonuclease P protein subunit n=1 Tax=Torulaspora globosa TaxID=48254 RepID=A0A7G3ZK67_9SACH|nr:uncharacterized protein HG536_0F02280 [Torulaspora globosa]QLL33903.1 hypothetical protein HG536_0F02280 [Torulaspora globosa]
MDRSQLFIKEHLLTKNFKNPEKPVKENRLQETLLLLPTDGGLSSRLKRSESLLKISADNLDGKAEQHHKHRDYKRINANSKVALKNYINTNKANAQRALHIAHEKKLLERKILTEYLKNHETALWNALPHFKTFLPMHEKLWVGYMRDLLNIPAKISDSSKLTINGQAALMKLSMADYNGAFLKVASSRNRNLIGIEGIVIWDSQKNFIMVTRGKLIDELKIIPKKGTVFNFEIPVNEHDALLYTILGDRFKYRSNDRAGRKFKSRRCDDMLHYLTT